MGEDTKSPISGIKIASLAAFVLTLLTWVFFYVALPEVPLNTEGTVVTFGFWWLVVFSGTQIWKRKSGRVNQQKRRAR